MVSRRRTFAVHAVVAVLAGGPLTAAWAQDATHSVVTTLDLKACAVLRHGPDGAAWRCAGLPGYPVFVSTGDERFFVSAGVKPELRRAHQQTLRAFNSPFPEKGARAAMEWRVTRDARGRAVPYATILRYYTVSDTAKGEVLVVSKVTPQQTCQVALIDALANADALGMARRLADTTAREFDCAKPPVVEGSVGKSPM